MKMLKALRYTILCLTSLSMYCCSSGEDLLSLEEHPSSVEEDNVFLSFNKWIYSQMNYHYLWREDLPDSTDCNYDLPPRDFFKSILSSKDRFSYMINNSEYSPSQKFDPGFAYQIYKDQNGLEAALVLYVKDPSIQSSYIKRGEWIKIVYQDNHSLQYSPVKFIENRFEYSDQILSLSIPASSNRSTVLLDSIYQGKIGYICYTEFDEEKDLIIPLTKFKNNNITDLILDLRYNPGGYVRTCRYLTNCIVPESAYGDIFQITKYNDRISGDNLIKTGKPELYNYFGYPTYNLDHEKGGYTIIPLNLSRLFVLTSSHTASASEALILCASPYMEIIHIGENTVGKGVGSYTLRDRNFKYAIQPVTMQYYNKNGQTVTNAGLKPDIYVPEGYDISKRQIGDCNEPLLNTALSVIYSPNDRIPHKNIGIINNQSLIPVGDPSYISEFKNKQYNEIN